MDSPPIPKPRTAFIPQNDPTKKPVPLPRTKTPKTIGSEKVTASDIMRSIGTVSKQISDDVSLRVQNSAKSANEKIEKSILEGTRLAKDGIERTLTTSRAMRDSVAKSVMEGTKSASIRLRGVIKSPEQTIDSREAEHQRCVSMPVIDVSLFDNIQFHSPLLEQKKFHSDLPSETNGEKKTAMLHLNLSSKNYDDMSFFSTNSDSNTDSASSFSQDSRDCEQGIFGLSYDCDQSMTYDTPKITSRQSSIVSISSNSPIPESVERRVKDNGFDFLRQNSLYENWKLPSETTSQIPIPRPSKSTIYEFDPLNSAKTQYDGKSNELLLLESFLIGDTYGTITATDNGDDNIDDLHESAYFNPPTPPERSDSLLPSEEENNTLEPTDTSKNDRKSNWFDNGEDSTVAPVPSEVGKTKVSPQPSVMQRFTNILKFDKVAKHPPTKSSQVERPSINPMPMMYFSGLMTRIISGGVEDLFKNSQTRYCVLSEQKLMCYSDTTNSILKEAYTLLSIFSVQILLPLSSSTANNTYWFELTVSGGSFKSSYRKVLFSCNSASERRNWAQKIVEHITDGFPTKYSAEFTRFGWCYLKEGVSGEWQGAWVMLIRRVLVYFTTKDTSIRTVDLRKTRCVVTQDADEETKGACGSDGPNLLLDCPNLTIYLHFLHERELKGWRYMIKLAAHNNGSYIHHQQLTKDDVPAIVEKCINFLYAHGSMSEGIYRRAGSSLTLAELLARFRRDAWSVQLSPTEHSEHDVAGTLKRFFRDLPEPLVPRDLHQRLVAAQGIKDMEARCIAYAALMGEAPQVARRTARRLFAHLHFLHTLASANKMSAENLASVWAPTIMPATLSGDNIQTAWSSQEVSVVRDLIAQYPGVWQPGAGELRREAAVRRVLKRVAASSAPAAPRAGDLRIWVHMHERSHTESIALTPNKTCADLCIELCEKAGIDSHLLMLEEVICSESMRRVLHLDEVVMDVVLRWGYWDEEDRKDNYLLIRENRSLQDLEALRGSTSLVCGELKYASDKSKAFKLHMFEFQNSKLCYFKDKQGSNQLGEWHIKDILWYVGHEPKRNPQSRWAITFIPRNNKPKRCKEKPWFGCTVAGAVSEDHTRWMATMLCSEHPVLLPTPRLVIT